MASNKRLQIIQN